MKKNTLQAININLLRRHDQSLFDSIFTWALAVGRLLIIITQFIALGAFLFRFVLDRQIIDLNDKIQDEQTVISYLENDEKKYRALQARLMSIAMYQDQAGEQEKILSEIVRMATGKMIFTSLSSSKESVTFDGIASSVGSLQSLMSEFKKFPGVTSVSLNSLKTLVLQNQISASVTLSFAKTAVTTVPLVPPAVVNEP